MHPQVRENKPGKCPVCGMTLVTVPKSEGEHSHSGNQMQHTHGANAPMGHMGHDHHKMMIDDFKKRFYLTLVLTVPIMLLSPMIQHWLGIQFQFASSAYVLMGLSSVVFFYGGWPFLTGLVQEVKARVPGMMTLGYIEIK